MVPSGPEVIAAGAGSEIDAEGYISPFSAPPFEYAHVYRQEYYKVVEQDLVEWNYTTVPARERDVECLIELSGVRCVVVVSLFSCRFSQVAISSLVPTWRIFPVSQRAASAVKMENGGICSERATSKQFFAAGLFQNCPTNVWRVEMNQTAICR